MKLSNDPVKLPLNASPLRPAEGENIGPASLANLRSALCTEYRLPDDTDRCKAWLSLREGWDTEKQKSKKMNELEISWLVYYYLSANFIFRKGWHTVKYINIKKIWHKYLVLDNFLSAKEISKNWCRYYLCQKFIHICQYSAKVQCVNNRSSFGRYSHCVMVWLWSIQCMHVIYTFICNCTIVTLFKIFIDISQKNIILNLYVHVHELVNVPD